VKLKLFNANAAELETFELNFRSKGLLKIFADFKILTIKRNWTNQFAKTSARENQRSFRK
jgi:hypothetical protein